MENVQSIRNKFRIKHTTQQFTPDKSGVNTIELIGVQFLADEQCIFGNYNEEYVQKELAWYQTQSRSIDDMEEPVPAIWRAIADPYGFIQSNYGWCIWSEDNYNQYDNCFKQLNNDPNSRRAIMIYTRPEIQEDYNQNGMSDFICTNTVQYFIRDDKLISFVNMRSNDVVFGYRNDRAWQLHVQEKLAKDLGVECGDLIWNVGSLHVYERHFHLVEER